MPLCRVPLDLTLNAPELFRVSRQSSLQHRVLVSELDDIKMGALQIPNFNLAYYMFPCPGNRQYDGRLTQGISLQPAPYQGGLLLPADL